MYAADSTIEIPVGFQAEVAILSADIKGSSSRRLTERDRLELMSKLTSFVNSHLRAIAICIVNKVAGDGLLVVTGNVEALPKIASRLRGVLIAVAHERKLGDAVNLRVGASFGRLYVVSGVGHKTADVAGDAITRAVRIQSANKDCKSLWCDEPLINALIRSRASVATMYEGLKELRITTDEYAETPIWSIAEESIEPGWFRKLTCFNQGRTIQQWCMASWMHRSLKDTLVLAQESRNESSLARLREERTALQDYLCSSLQEAATRNFEILQEHFAHRLESTAQKDPKKPRICLKGFAETGVDNAVSVVDIQRENGQPFGEQVWQHENSGFHHVVTTGTPFLCNDLAAPDVSYKNPRLLDQKVDELRRSLKTQSKVEVTAIDWQMCWKDGHRNQSSCYRSTLIIPLTLKHNGLAEAFFTRFGGGIHNERIIYGALCFDHVDPHFFRDDDVDVGYIAADWLSLYLLSQINYTTGSGSYDQSGKMLAALQS